MLNDHDENMGPSEVEFEEHKKFLYKKL